MYIGSYLIWSVPHKYKYSRKNVLVQQPDRQTKADLTSNSRVVHRPRINRQHAPSSSPYVWCFTIELKSKKDTSVGYIEAIDTKRGVNV